MSDQLQQFDKLRGLLTGLDDDRRGQFDDAAWSRLTELLRNDPVARRNYLQFMLSDAVLRLEHARPLVALDRRPADGIGLEGESKAMGREAGHEGFNDCGFGIGDFHVPNLQISKFPNQQIPSLSTTHSPLSTRFVGGPVFSYIAATLILGLMLLSAWAYTITHDYGASFVHNSRELTAPGGPAPQRPEPIFVARVTGMKDCRWADPQTETFAGAFVPLGRKYALSSGLMEITYRSGAKVILEGPCRYEVESAAGGYLALGKLTARVEKRSEVRGRRSEAGGLAASAASAQPQAANLPSPIGRGAGGEGSENQKQSALTLILSGHHEVVVERGPDSSPKPQDLSPKTEISKSPNLQINSPLSTLHSPLFTVRTPTAIVTDLGTEFGVEVGDDGATEVHVLDGEVLSRAVFGGEKAKSVRVKAGEAVKIDLDRGEIVSARCSEKRFVRAMPKQREPDADTYYVRAVLEDKPLGYWPLNELPGARRFADHSGNGFHGWAIGDVWAGRPGPLSAESRAVELNGEGCIDLGRQDRFALENGFTIEAWIYASPEAGMARIISADNAVFDLHSADRIGWSLEYAGNNRFGNEEPCMAMTAYGIKDAVFRSTPVPRTTWLHVAAVFDGGNVARLFLGGRPRADAEIGWPAKTGPVWLTIGAMSSKQHFWRGRLAHVAVYPRELSADRINYHFLLKDANGPDNADRKEPLR